MDMSLLFWVKTLLLKVVHNVPSLVVLPTTKRHDDVVLYDVIQTMFSEPIESLLLPVSRDCSLTRTVSVSR
jgi:hypothetical protein